MNRRNRKKKVTLERAGAAATPASGMLYVPAGYAQSVYGQTFYGGSTKNIPVGQQAIFSPGQPLPAQPALNPNGLPIQWKYMPASNTFPPDRTNGAQDIPSFQQLRNLAKLYDGVTLCERVWFDLVPRMQLKIELKPEYVAAGADPKDYQAEISYFQTWFESPDKMHDLHSWIRMALREQTQVDELYIYKRKKRGGGLYSMEIISGDQMKPLLDDWGKIPQPPSYAYQQYPWGIPGAWFRTDEMIHYQESPAADNPYGQSRVERIIMLVNQGLRKQRKDLTHFTEGNIPQGLMKVPETSTWTPDQIDAFEQSWNALMAGNASQQVRMRFTQPGMEYQAFEQYQLDPTFDKFILNISVSAYGLSMQDVAFTEDIHKSSGDSQQNVTYRRTIDPLAVVYASFLTQAMNNDFDPDLHGDMLMASFGGFDDEEDVSTLAGAYSGLVTSGILGVTNAGKLLKLPDDPNAPYIGRILVTKDGPIFLDDMASDKMRNAAMQSHLATLQAPPAGTAPAKPAPGNAKPGGKAQSSDDDDEPSDESDNADQESKGTQQRQQGTPQPIDEEEDEEESEPYDEEEAEDDEDEEPTPEDLVQEQEITSLLKSDSNEPFSELERFERHTPGGKDHDQKTHGDGAHPAYGAKHDTSPAAKQASAAVASLDPKLQAAQKAVTSAEAKFKAAQTAYHAASSTDKKAAAATLDQARTALKTAKQSVSTLKKQETAQRKAANAKVAAQKKAASEKAKTEKAAATAKANAEKQSEQKQKAQATAKEKAQAAKEAAQKKAQAQKLAEQKKAAAAKLKAEMQKVQIEKQVAAAKAKAAKMAAQAQQKAQVAAAKAAKSQAQAGKSQAAAAMKQAKQQQQSAKALQTMISTLSSKAALYNSLASRKTSKSWTAQDAEDAQSVAEDLHSLMEAVNNHEDESDASALMTKLNQSMSSLQARKGVSSAQSSVLQKLGSQVQQQLSRSVIADDIEEFDYDEEEAQEEPEEQGEQRYTISELLQFLQTQVQTTTTNSSTISPVTQLAQERTGDDSEREASAEYRRWRTRALEDVKANRAQRGFTTTLIPESAHSWISNALTRCTTADEVRDVFSRARDTKKPLGEEIDWSDEELDRMAEISPTDLKTAGELWRTEAPHALRGLLQAEASDGSID